MPAPWTWIWLALGVLALVAGVRYLLRLRRVRGRPPTVDDDALRRILEHGTLQSDEPDDAPLDMDEAARAEDEFWAEHWDEPEEWR